MAYVIDSCFHWIGYHMVQHLLNKGFEVIGVDALEDEKKEALYMFVGRNSCFQHFHTLGEIERYSDRGQIDGIIGVTEGNLHDYPYGQIKIADSIHELQESKDIENIRVPLSYGEWMPRDETYGFPGDHQIVMEDLVESESACYIEDFIKEILEKVTGNTHRTGGKSNDIAARDLAGHLNDHFQRHKHIYMAGNSM
ncbi:hypothetical protein [Thalassobacillus pellis]|uniref:hypothetical protein n=1 Tax=Thalassobacillus pellis TaxID=748008 RepID=UPI00196078A0|nr:hypothetical protein [Thalassobacillus pellis]MBM7554044.1 hypothetical protein [Thalassobacillus pellis]